MRRRRRHHHHALTAIALLLTLVLPACDVDLPAPPAPPDQDDTVTVGSFDFPESELVAEIYAQALESHGLEVVRTFAIGPRELTMPALERGLLEVMPEYSGSALDFLGGTPTANAPATFSALRDALETRGLVTLRPSGAEDRNVFVMTDDAAERLGIRHLSDLRDDAASLRIGGPPECRLRPLCLAGLEERYDLRFDRFVALDAAGPLTLQALDEGFVDVALLFSTHPRARGGGLRVLVDDRGLQPAEQIVPLVAAAAATRFEPTLSAALDPVSEALTSQALRLMNGQIDEGAPIADVAHAWLVGRGLD